MTVLRQYVPDLAGIPTTVDANLVSVLRRNLEMIATVTNSGNGGAVTLQPSPSSSAGGASRIGRFDHIIFNGVTPATPLEGYVWYDSTDSHTLCVRDDITGTTLNVGQETYLRAVNKTLSTIADTKAVYVSGAQGNRPKIDLADNTVEASADNLIGLVTADIANNAEGHVTVYGVVNGYNTSTFTEGNPLYLSTAGDLVDVMPDPVGTDLIIPVGYALNSTANGKVLVAPRGLYHLAHLHDVLDGTPTNGYFLKGNGTRWSKFNLFGTANTWTATNTFDVTGNAIVVSGSYTSVGDGVRVLRTHTDLAGTASSSRGGLFALKWNVDAGKTNTGTSNAAWLAQAYRRDSSGVTDGGTMSELYGGIIQVGHGTNGLGSPTTSAATGIDVQPYNYGGTISTYYGLRLRGFTGSGTVTTAYGIYQEAATATNSFAGPMTFSNATMTWSGNPTHSGNHTWSGNATFNGNVTIGNATSDTITLSSRFVSALIPSTTGTCDLGTASLRWNVGYLTSLNVSGNSTLGAATSNTLTLTARVASNIDPSTTNTRSLGQDTLRWAAVHATEFYLAGTTVSSSLAGKEPSLGNPVADGYVLASTAAGVRSWYNIAGALAGYLPLTGGTITGDLTVGDASTDTLTVNATPTFNGEATFNANITGKGSAKFGDAHADSFEQVGQARYHYTNVDNSYVVEYYGDATGQTILQRRVYGRSSSSPYVVDTYRNVGSGSVLFKSISATNLTTYKFSVSIDSSLTVNGNTTLGDATSDNCTVNALMTTKGRRETVTSYSGDQTLTTSDHRVRYTGTGGHTFTLPAATGTFQTYIIRNSGTGSVTIDGNAAETIDGAATVVVPVGGHITITDVGTGVWEIFG